MTRSHNTRFTAAREQLFNLNFGPQHPFAHGVLLHELVGLLVSVFFVLVARSVFATPSLFLYIPLLGILVLSLVACAVLFTEYSTSVGVTVAKRLTQWSAVGPRPFYFWRWRVEFWFFFVAFALSALAAIVTTNLLTLLVLFEIITFATCFFLLVWDRSTVTGFENALLYFLLSSFFSLLYIFGLVHFILIAGHVDVSFAVPFQGQWYRISFIYNASELLLFGLILFKLGVAPLHSWVIPVYSTTNLAILALFSSSYKILYAIVLVKLTFWAAASSVAVSPLYIVLFGIGLSSILIGAVLLTGQTTLRGFIAASGIYNMGFVVAAIACGPVGAALGVSFAVWYAFTLLFFIYNCLKFRLGPVGVHGWHELPPPYYLAHFAGLVETGRFNSFSVVAISTLLFDFMALPPLPGFIFKFNILFLLVVALGQNVGALGALTLLLTIALPATLFCYFRVLKLCWFDAPNPRARTVCFSEYKTPVLRLLFALFTGGFLLSSGTLLSFVGRTLYRAASL